MSCEFQWKRVKGGCEIQLGDSQDMFLSLHLSSTPESVIAKISFENKGGLGLIP